ncbi:MAG: nucleotidyltransferase domain-containing protein [bacterium]
MQPDHLHLAGQIAELFASLQEVEAVALGGSRASGASDESSDIDLYVYTRAEIPLENRQEIVERSGGATETSMDMNYWGLCDEWVHAPTGIEIDISYFEASWMEERLDRVIHRRQANLGYTTCFWHTIRRSIALRDPRGWFSALQTLCQSEYPEALRQNIIALNYPVLRSIIPSYSNQLDKAIKRHDLVSVNHRLAALFASYFDILFALNRQLHPGEKRLLELAAAHCAKLPSQMEADIAAILQSASGNLSGFSAAIARLLDGLDRLLDDEGFVCASDCRRVLRL